MGLLYQNIHLGALSDLSFFQYVSINLDYVHHLPSELQTNMIGHCSCVATDFFLEIFLWCEKELYIELLNPDLLYPLFFMA